jgi:hypothetical protein
LTEDERLSLAEAHVATVMVSCPLCLGRHGCRACDNKGSVNVARADRISRGMLMRYQRMQRGMKCSQEAARLGISLKELMDMELGIAPNDSESVTPDG